MEVYNSTKSTHWYNFTKDLDQHEQLRKMYFVFKELGTTGAISHKGTLVLKGRYTVRQLCNINSLYIDSRPKPTHSDKLYEP
jgi:translation initiation factor 2 beta subunit (eIF-2beta)/eIF-5